MLRYLALLYVIIVPSLAIANCEISPNLLNQKCGAEYYVPKNQKQLEEYLRDGKFKEGQLLNLELNFDIKDKEITVASFCDVRINRKVSLRSSQNGICIMGASVELTGENQFNSDKKAPIFIGAGKSITIRRSGLETKGEIILTTKVFNPFEGQILISRDSKLKGEKITITTPSNLTINKDSSLKSTDVILNGGNCEIGENDDRENDDERDYSRSCKKFSPKFKYAGNCATNPIPTNIKINSVVDSKDSLKVSYSLQGRPENTGVRWRFNQDEVNLGIQLEKNFIFPGRYLIEAVVVDQSGQFRKIGKIQDLSPNKFNQGQMAVFQFAGLRKYPSSVSAYMGLNKFILTRSVEMPELYFGEIPKEFAGSKLIYIPALGFKGSFNLVGLPTISDPDSYIAQNIDQLITLIGSIRTTNQSVVRTKTALQALFEELRSKISELEDSEKQKVAEYMQAMFFSDLISYQSFSSTRERPIRFLDLIINNVYADDVSSAGYLQSILTILESYKFLANVGIAIGGLVGYVAAPKAYKPLVLAITFVAIFAVLSSNAEAQNLLNDVHAINSNSLYLKHPNKINSDSVATFTIFGQAVPLDSIPPTTPLVIQAINAKNNTNSKLGKINKQIVALNSDISLLGLSPGIETLPLLYFPQTSFPTILNTKYITNVRLLSSEEGLASIKSYSKSGNNLLITFKSQKTQKASVRVTYVNADLGITKNIDTDIVITVAPKAIINFTKDKLVVNFDSTVPENPNIEGLTYSWNFGDGQTASTTSKTLTHTYSKAGTYNVTLTVTDAYGVSSTTSVEIVLIADEKSFFLRVNPQGSYYFVDTIGGYLDDGSFLRDMAVSPTELDLTTFFVGNDVYIKPGDFIKLQSVGATLPGPGWSEVETNLAAVFRDKLGNFLSPGSRGEFYSIVTPASYPRGVSTDIPEDFWIPQDHEKILEVPAGATNIAFSVPDSYFADNSDPNGDYGVVIKVTIVPNNLGPLY